MDELARLLYLVTSLVPKKLHYFQLCHFQVCQCILIGSPLARTSWTAVCKPFNQALSCAVLLISSNVVNHCVILVERGGLTPIVPLPFVPKCPHCTYLIPWPSKWPHYMMAACRTLSNHPPCYHTLHTCQPSQSTQRHLNLIQFQSSAHEHNCILLQVQPRCHMHSAPNNSYRVYSPTTLFQCLMLWNTDTTWMSAVITMQLSLAQSARHQLHHEWWFASYFSLILLAPR